MYFVTGGDLEYWRSALMDPAPIQTGFHLRSTSSLGRRKEDLCARGDWLSEVALWVSWRLVA